MKLVIYPSVEDERLTKIQEAAPEMEIINAADTAAAIEGVGDADAFFGKLTPPMLQAASQLRWVQSPTASLEHYLFPELVKHPCVLTNMRGLFSDVIATQVFGYILCFARNLHHYVRQQAESRWAPMGGEEHRVGFLGGPGVVGPIDQAHVLIGDCTLGIIGLGAIGREVARIGTAFGMRVLAVDPVQQELPDSVDVLWPIDQLDKLLAESDYTVICAPHTPVTEKMFGREQFEAMKRTAYLINIGRGAIVDLSGLTEALQSEQIAGAGLDVFETEPLPKDHALWKMENVIITPHVAGYCVRIAERHLDVVVDNVGRFVRDEPLRNVADKENWF